MKITNLKLTNFRNYEKLNLHFSNYKNIIIGNNGLGKTNIVEAIYYLSITKSFRTNNQEVLIRENSDFAVIEATVLNKIKNKYRSSHLGAAETNPTRNHEVAGSIPGLVQ